MIKQMPVKPPRLWWRALPDNWAANFVQQGFPAPTTPQDFLDQLTAAKGFLEAYKALAKHRDIYLDMIANTIAQCFSREILNRWADTMALANTICERMCNSAAGCIVHARNEAITKPAEKVMENHPTKPNKNADGTYYCQDVMSWLKHDFDGRVSPFNTKVFHTLRDRLRDLAKNVDNDVNGLTWAILQTTTSCQEIQESEFLKQAFLIPVLWVVRVDKISVRKQHGIMIFRWPDMDSTLSALEDTMRAEKLGMEVS